MCFIHFVDSALFFLFFFSLFHFHSVSLYELKPLNIKAMQQTEKMEFLITRITSALQMIWSSTLSFSLPSLSLVFVTRVRVIQKFSTQKLLRFFFGALSGSMSFQKELPLNVNVKYSFTIITDPNNVNIWAITLFEYCAACVQWSEKN